MFRLLSVPFRNAVDLTICIMLPVIWHMSEVIHTVDCDKHGILVTTVAAWMLSHSFHNDQIFFAKQMATSERKRNGHCK